MATRGDWWRQPTVLHRNYMVNAGLSDTLRVFIEHLKTSYGPNSRLKLLQNDAGGHVTMTSSSGRLMKVMYVEEPIVKVIVNAVKMHIRLHGDGGMMCLLLCATLLRNASVLHQNNLLVSEVFHCLHKMIVAHYEDEACTDVRRLDFTGLHDLIRLARSVISPKQGCILNRAELGHVTKVIVETFIRTFTPSVTNSINDILVIAVEGSSPFETELVGGLLFATEKDFRELPVVLDGRVRFVMVTASLAGDYGNDADDVTVIKGGDGDDVNAALLKRIFVLCDAFVSAGVKLLLCQKIVHHCIVAYLQRRGVLVVQRLGLHTTQYVLKVTDGRCVSSVLQPVDEDDLCGYWDQVSLASYGGRAYYHLRLESCAVATLLVVNRTEESLAELEYVCRVALDSLRIAARHPRLINGRGCFERRAIDVVRHKVRINADELAREHKCSKAQLYTIVEQFCRAIFSTISHFTVDDGEELMLFDDSNLLSDLARLSLQHGRDANSTKACVGVLETDGRPSKTCSDDESVDLLCIKLAALHTAVYTACALVQVDGLFESVSITDARR